MNVSAHTFRPLVSASGLVAVVAVLAVPTALARPADTDGNTMVGTQVALDARSPDTLDATVQASASDLDPAIATAMAAHQRVQVSGDLRSPDTLDVGVQAPVSGIDPAIATAMAAHTRVQVPGDLRSPDARDIGARPTIQDSPTVAAPVPSDGFDWTRFAIVLAAIGALFVAVGTAIAVQSRAKHAGHGKSAGSITAA